MMKNLKLQFAEIRKIGIFGILILLCIQVQATEKKNINSIFDELSYEDVIDVSLEVDMEALTFNKRNEDKHPAIFSYIDKNGVSKKWNIKVNLRGKYRRLKCTAMPPLKINFDKEDLKAANLARFNDMKLVTQCIDDNAVAKDLVLKEYLGYKIYNEITINSFRVQLLNIKYIDTKTGQKQNQVAFLIEDTAQLRARLGAKKQKNKLGIHSASFDQQQIKTAALFEYMIGNADWSLVTSKNLKMINKEEKVMAIPYDFDFSGVVNAPYALPNTNVGQSFVGERIYLGIEENTEELQETIQLFNTKKRTIFKLIKGFKQLRPSARRAVAQYIESFYVNLSDFNINNAIVEAEVKLENE